MSPKHRLRVTLLLPLFCLVSVVFAQPNTGKKKERIGGHSPRQILNLFGYRGVLGITEQQVAGYRRVFGFADVNRDGRHSKKEYIEDGFYLTKQTRQGIFRATDSDGDGFVTEVEYVINRMITDEAKEIFHKLDTSRDSKLTAKEISPAESSRMKNWLRPFSRHWMSMATSHWSSLNICASGAVGRVPIDKKFQESVVGHSTRCSGEYGDK